MKLVDYSEAAHKTILCEYKHPEYPPKVIVDKNNEILGYIWYPVQDSVLYADMLEVVQKGEGIGTNIVRFLFKKFNLICIKGCLLREEGERSYHFWTSLGAEIEVKLEDYEPDDDGIMFYLFRENLIR